MAIKTMNLRHVWRTVNDCNEDLKVLVLQQWHKAEGSENEDYVNGGFWKDVDISSCEEPTPPKEKH
jgi:hypothetical protein